MEMIFGIVIWVVAFAVSLGGNWFYDNKLKKPPEKVVIKTESFEIDPSKQYIWFVGELPNEVLEDLVDGIERKYPNLNNILIVNTDPPRTILEF